MVHITLCDADTTGCWRGGGLANQLAARWQGREMWREQEAISDLAGLAIPSIPMRRSPAFVAAGSESPPSEHELLHTASSLEEDASVPRRVQRRPRIPSSSSESDSSDDSEDDRPRARVAKLMTPAQAQAAAAAKAKAEAVATQPLHGAGGAPPAGSRKSGQPHAGSSSQTQRRRTLPAVRDRAAESARQAQPAQTAETSSPTRAVDGSATSRKRADLHPQGDEEPLAQRKRVRKPPNAFVAEPASGKLHHDDAAKGKSKRAATVGRRHQSGESEATLAGLKAEYARAVGRQVRGRKANDPDWLRQKIAEATSSAAKFIPAAPAAPATAHTPQPVAGLLSSTAATTAAKGGDAETLTATREMRDWLFVRRIGSTADALIDEGFTSLKDLIEANFTTEELEEECFAFNMYARKRLLRELEYETKSRRAAVAVGSPPISRPEEYSSTKGTATSALRAPKADEEPDPEDMPLSDEEQSDDNGGDDDEIDSVDRIEAIVSPAQSARPENEKDPVQLEFNWTLHPRAPTQPARLEREKKRTRSPDECNISDRPVSSPPKSKQKRTLPPLNLRKIVPCGLERPTPSVWTQVASTDLFSTFWELSIHDLDPEIPGAPSERNRAGLRKENVASSFNAKSRDWVLGTLEKFVEMFLEHCIFPRARHSKVAGEDARYCCEFVSRMQQAKTPRFSLVVYTDTLMKSFPEAVKNCGGSEEQILSLTELLSETFRRASRWRTSAASFLDECRSATCDTTHEEFVELSSTWHSLLVAMLIEKLAPTSATQQRHEAKRCHMLVLQKLLQWLTFTSEEHSTLVKHLQQLEKAGHVSTIALATQLRQQLPQPQRKTNAKPVPSPSPHQINPAEPHSTLVSRLVSFYREAYSGQESVLVDEFLQAFYRKDPRAKSEMQVLRGTYPQPARFLAEACGGKFNVTNHGLQARVGPAHTGTTKLSHTLRRRLIAVFQHCSGTQKVNSTEFFQALKKHDPAAKELLGQKPMVYLTEHCSGIFKIQDRGNGESTLCIKFRPLTNPQPCCMRTLLPRC